MGRVNDTISNVNAAVRNLLMLVLVGGAGYGGYKAYELYNEPQKELAEKEKQLAEQKAQLDTALKDASEKQQKVDELTAVNKEQSAKIDSLDLSMRLLKVRHRLARLTVLDQHEIASLNAVPPSSGTQTSASRPNVTTKIQFVEINDEGQPIGEAKQFDIVGDLVYLDYLTVTFDDKFVEQADLDRSTSIALFQRLFGEHQPAVQGFHLDTVGTRPGAYGRGTQMSEFEKKIWNDFWLIANDQKRAAELGIHAAQGQAPSMRVQPGKTYEVEIRATGGFDIRPVSSSSPPASEAKNGS